MSFVWVCNPTQVSQAEVRVPRGARPGSHLEVWKNVRVQALAGCRWTSVPCRRRTKSPLLPGGQMDWSLILEPAPPFPEQQRHCILATAHLFCIFFRRVSPADSSVFQDPTQIIQDTLSTSRSRTSETPVESFLSWKVAYFQVPGITGAWTTFEGCCQATPSELTSVFLLASTYEREVVVENQS